MNELNIAIGNKSFWSMPNDDRIASIRAPRIEVESLSAAIDQALSQPLDFPPLDQALVPGDQLVLAVDPQLPSLVEVTGATVNWFCEHGTPANNIRVVLAGEGHWNAEELTQQIEKRTESKVSVELHDFDDAEKVAYVAANEASDPIYLNRSLVDADVVIPITCTRPHWSLDYFGAFGTFPLFSNRATRGEFYSLPRLREPTAHAKLQSWADQAAWWVGVLVGIQVIPAANDGVAKILAGQLQPLEEQAQSLMTPIWSWPESSPRGPSDLLVAQLCGPACSQSWLSVARALFNALRCVASQGSIVIATQLSEPIGRGLARLRDPHQTPVAIAKKLASDSSDDALAAAVILSAIASHHVYLISNLRCESIESLGLGVITHAEQLTHLVGQHASSLVVEGAQYREMETFPRPRARSKTTATPSHLTSFKPDYS